MKERLGRKEGRNMYVYVIGRKASPGLSFKRKEGMGRKEGRNGKEGRNTKKGRKEYEKRKEGLRRKEGIGRNRKE